jgi:hypothetical protein
MQNYDFARSETLSYTKGRRLIALQQNYLKNIWIYGKKKQQKMEKITKQSILLR